MHVHRSKFASDVATSLPPASTGPLPLLAVLLDADDTDVTIVLDVVVPTTPVVTVDARLLVTEVPP
jgi:hypothetical protein